MIRRWPLPKPPRSLTPPPHSTATEGAGRFRKLLLSNENVKESIIDTAGALALMRHVGFELQGSGEGQSLIMPQPSARRAHAHASAHAPRRPLLPVRSAIAFLCGFSGSADGARATGLRRAHARAREAGRAVRLAFPVGARARP